MNRERTPWGLTAERLVPSALFFPKRWEKQTNDAAAFSAMHKKEKEKKNEKENEKENENEKESSSIAAVGISEPVANAEEAAAAASCFLF
ncbi:MAG: hypothetical protein IJJ98_14395 [Prevotella sp.]|nr:hypothetical protein [Prevotella sp.]